MTVDTSQSLSLDAALQQAIAHHQAGRLQEAEHLYRAILQAWPNQATANHNLGVLAGQVGQHAGGLPYLKTALEASPSRGEYALSYAEALLATGWPEEALKIIQATIRNGFNIPATQALHQKAQAAVRLAREAAPTPAEMKQLVALFNTGRYEELESLTRLLVERYPDSGFVWTGLGVSLRLQGKSEASLPALQKATALLPDDAETHNNLGNTLRDLGRLDDAVASYAKALAIKPDFADVHYNLGNALQLLGKFDDAVASYKMALEIDPDNAEAHNNLGNALRELGKSNDAMASHQRALEINPDNAEAHNNLGNALRDIGRIDDALAAYQRALTLQPHNLQHAIHAHLLLPIIPDTPDALTVWRERYQAGIAALMDAPGALKEPDKGMDSSSFYLAYHNFNNRTVMEALHRLFRSRSPDLTTASPHVATWQPPAARGQRIKVGFLSALLVHQTIGKLYQGFIKHLDRSRFEVVVIRTPDARQDDISRHIDALADKVLTLPLRLKDQQQAVAAEKLDVLFYPDIGMVPATYLLAYARLAPVQAVAWGHPDTTGLDTMDYFVSAATIEPEDAEEHYTERLIRLTRLPCYYRPLMAPTEIPTRAALGLPETGTLYGCPQTLFKFHPDFDNVLAAIAEGDPAGHIILLRGKGVQSTWADQLRARWAKRAPILLERVRFLPPMSLEYFMALTAHTDVLLDPIHFGSGNTLYEAMVYGTPVVTWAGRFMRGRIVAAAYQQMGVAEAPIAQRLEDYAPLALALGRDPQRRQSLRQILREAADRKLFADMQAVREFEAFLEAAVAAAGRGEKLPVGWKPDIQADQARQEGALT